MYSSHNNITCGLFYMTDEEIETKQKDKLVSLKVSKKKEILKAELVGDLVQTEWDQAEGKTVISKMLIRAL